MPRTTVSLRGWLCAIPLFGGPFPPPRAKILHWLQCLDLTTAFVFHQCLSPHLTYLTWDHLFLNLGFLTYRVTSSPLSSRQTQPVKLTLPPVSSWKITKTNTRVPCLRSRLLSFDGQTGHPISATFYGQHYFDPRKPSRVFDNGQTLKFDYTHIHIRSHLYTIIINMVSLAPPKPLLEAHTEISNLPDLSDAAYFAQVLRLPVEKLESHVDDELAVRARHIGCHAQNLSDKRYTSSAESASTAITYHARTFSTGSNASASTTLTVNSSILYPPRSPKPQSDADEKRQTTGLNFTQYDKYLSQIDKNLDQPKIRKLSVPTDTSAKSVFSVSTRRSFFSVKSGIKNKFRLRRKSIAPFVPTLLVQTTPPFSYSITANRSVTVRVFAAGMTSTTNLVSCTICRAVTHTVFIV